MFKILKLASLIFGTSGVFIFTFVVAQTYPASCPAEAQAIVKVVGGCSSVNKSQYPTVHEKCCAVTPKPTPVKSPAPSITPSKQLKLIEYAEPFRDSLKLIPATPTQELKPPAQSENKLVQIIRDRFQKTFDRMLRLFRFR